MELSSINKATIETYDNPGWGISIYFKDSISLEKKRIKLDYNSEEDWLSIFMDTNSLDFNGDEKKLENLFIEIMDYVDFSFVSNITEVKELLRFFQDWYTNECDEYWEHLYGIKGEISSQGHLHLVIDLDETRWQDEQFRNNTSCRKIGNKFLIDSDKEQIVNCLKIFKDWIEST